MNAGRMAALQALAALSPEQLSSLMQQAAKHANSSSPPPGAPVPAPAPAAEESPEPPPPAK